METDGPTALTLNATLNAALRYAELGLRVIPLQDRSKKPRILGWPERATTDQTVIRGWLEQAPAANIGIVGGHGLVILDVDPKNDGAASLDDLISEHGPLPFTAEVRTGSGGSHYYFSAESGVRVGNRAGFRPGLDIRAEGGQVAAPPSVHPKTGQEYVWIVHPVEGIAPIPACLLNEIVRESEIAVAAHAPAPFGKHRRTARKRRMAENDLQSPQERTADLADRCHVPPALDAASGQPGPFPARTADDAETEASIADMIERFPIPGVGCRHNLMVRAVGSLVAEGYADETITATMMRWWQRFYRQGLTATDEDEMEQELAECLRATRGNPDFKRGQSAAEYEVAAARMALPQAMLDRLNALVADLQVTSERRAEAEMPSESVSDPQIVQEDIPQRIFSGVGNSTPPPKTSNTHCNEGDTNQTSLMRMAVDNGGPNAENSMDVDAIGTPRTRRTRSLAGRLCESRDERWFVESLLVMLALRNQASQCAATPQGAPTLRFTHDQLGRIASVRFSVEPPVWDNKQFDRLKRKYVSRVQTDGQRDAATRFELLLETAKGQRARGSARGTPSVYQPTGIGALFPKVGVEVASPP
jgi:hypothetical protein